MASPRKEEEEPKAKVAHAAANQTGVSEIEILHSSGSHSEFASEERARADRNAASRPTNFTTTSSRADEFSEASSTPHGANILGRPQRHVARTSSKSFNESGTLPSQASPDGRSITPSAGVITALDDVLQCQFGEIAEDPNEETDVEPKAGKKMVRIADPNADDIKNIDSGYGKRSSLKEKGLGLFNAGDSHRRDSTEVRQDLGLQKKTACVRLAENTWFVTIFMLLTFYALFVPDLDLLFGDKDSKFRFSIITFVVCVLFVFEIVVQSLGRANYFLKAYFWLDLIAMASLLPDTWLFQAVINTNAFVAGRSSRLTRIIRIASRSSKATRLNRLTRIVRVASLLPKISALLGRKVKDDDTEKMLEKKLRRVFHFLDEDMDGMIPRSAALNCVEKMRADEPHKSGTQFGIPDNVKNLFKKKERSDSTLTIDRKLEKSNTTLTETLESQETMAGPAKSLASAGSISRMGTRESKDSKRARSDTKDENGKVSHGGPSIEPIKTLTTETSQAVPSPSSKRRQKRTYTTHSKADGGYTDDEGDPLDTVSFKEFRDIMVKDAWIYARLKRACQQSLKQGNNMQNLTSRHSEYIAVKVALGVLLLLFVLSMVEPAVEDKSGKRGLKHVTNLVKMKFSNETIGDPIDYQVHEQVDVWSNGAYALSDRRHILYLDLDKKVYCNDFVSGGNPCDWSPGRTFHWTARKGGLSDIDDDIRNSEYRIDDLTYINIPDLSDDDLSADELDERTDSVVVLYIRGETQKVAVMSILTTVLVIIIILSGIVLLTKDLTFLSRNLLRPLRELADDMESIAQLQLAGVSGTEDTVIDEGTSEVRLIRRTFENMKKAIKSWGKYVPWPVVQLLLRANVEANLEVAEKEVTIFFSDIASFTTIVESMPPESSLLLLSRYFNDMSKVIDDHGGVVLEFIGDAIQCIYGAPLINADHPTSAVKSALRMLAALRKMNDWSQTRNLPEVKIRCGVHTGRVLVGNMGFNMGFHSRMKYGIVGEDAHIPSRLEELNKSYSTACLISAHTFTMIDSDAFITRPIDYIHLRHTPQSVSELIYEVMDRDKRHAKSHPLFPAASKHAEAMELYRNRDFEEALQCFQDVAQKMKEITNEEDQASTLFIKRCEAYIELAPPPDWDGVWDRGGEHH